EVEDEVVEVSKASGHGPRQELHPGQGIRLGYAQVVFRPGSDEPPEEEASSDNGEEPAGPARLAKRLPGIAGADQGRSYRLPDSGALTLGKSNKHADIALHDLYVSRVHCVVEVQGEKVIVKHNEGDNGTLVNGKRITEPRELHIGDVVRIGNSHLRLETVISEDEEEVEEVEVVEEEAPEGEGHGAARAPAAAEPAAA